MKITSAKKRSSKEHLKRLALRLSLTDVNATSTVAKGKNGCKLRKMGIFVSNFEKYFVVWGCIL